MATYMIVCTFDPEANWEDISAVIPDEQIAAAELQKQGRLLSVRVSKSRDKVFLEVVAEDLEDAENTVQRLPMAKWWDLEIYEIALPV